MKEYKTVSSSNEIKFDEEINSLVAQGWIPDMTTYRSTAWAHGEGQNINASHGTFNAIMLTRDKA